MIVNQRCLAVMGYGNCDARRAGKDNGVCEDYNGAVSKVLGDKWINPQILSVQSLEAHQRRHKSSPFWWLLLRTLFVSYKGNAT